MTKDLLFDSEWMYSILCQLYYKHYSSKINVEEIIKAVLSDSESVYSVLTLAKSISVASAVDSTDSHRQ